MRPFCMRLRFVSHLPSFCWRVYCLLFALFLTGCGGAQRPAATSRVVERAEGFSERPSWADPNVPFSRQNEEIRVLGYLSIDAKQRRDAGFRATDSYARAELVRFLNTRVVAVLQDKLSTKEGGQISESITESAHLVIDDLKMAAHYWERTEDEEGSKLHLFSRLDIDRKTTNELLARVWKSNDDLRTPISDVQKVVSEQWDALANAAKTEGPAGSMPSGVHTPDWAKNGDSEDDQEFRFVCHGLASDDKQAQALASRMCTEKLCRIFGVQIKSNTSVRETLNGIDVESEVSEGCLDVRLEGRETEFSAGECGPRGCVQWMLQSYPKSAYRVERKRLETSTVIERQIVVQEGAVKYTDPAVCEKELRAYGRVEGRDLTSIEERSALLKRAGIACQGIDNRDSGLFTRLWHLIEEPLPTFLSNEQDQTRDFEKVYLYGSPSWHEELATARFIDQRIQQVNALLEDARLPLLAYQTLQKDPTNLAKVQKVMRPLYAYPFSNTPAAGTHAQSVHLVHRFRQEGQKDLEFFNFLALEAHKRNYSCYSTSTVDGRLLIRYLQAHASTPDAEWEASLQVLRRANESPSACAYEIIKGQKTAALKLRRAAQILTSIDSGDVQVFEEDKHKKVQSGVQALGTLLRHGALSPEQSMTLYLDWEPRLKGNDEERSKVRQDVLKSFEPKYSERNTHYCNRYLDQMERLKKQSGLAFQEASEGLLCECLRDEGGVTGNRRKNLILEMSKEAKRSCKWVKSEERPGGVRPPAERPPMPPGMSEISYRSRNTAQPKSPANARDVASELSKPLKECLSNTEVRDDGGGVLNAWVEVAGMAHRGGLSAAQVKVTIKSRASDLRRHEKKGWPTEDDLARTEQRATACIQQATGQMRPSAGSALSVAQSNRIWLLFTGSSVFAAGQVNK